MKQAARIGVSIGSLLLLIALFFSWRIFLVRLRTPRCCVFSFDTCFSETYKDEITTYAQTLDLRLASDPEGYVTLFKDHFPLIACIKTTLLSSGVLAVAIEGARPQCLINDDRVLVDCGIIVSVSSYEMTALACCPQLRALEEHLTSWSPKAIDFLLNRLSASLLASYEIWLSTFPEVMLSHKMQQKLTLFTRQDEIKADQLDGRGKTILAILENRGAFTNTKQKQWVADMRFHEMIVLVAK